MVPLLRLHSLTTSSPYGENKSTGWNRSLFIALLFPLILTVQFCLNFCKSYLEAVSYLFTNKTGVVLILITFGFCS